MNKIFTSIASLFGDEENAIHIKPAKLTFDERRKAANVALNRALLADHSQYGIKAMSKINVADKLRRQLNDSYDKHSEAMLASVEHSIKTFERLGR